MKALLRHEGETIRESDSIEGIDWNTGAPLTNASWCGGPYRLVDNYVEPAQEEDGDGHVPVEIIEEPVQEASEETDDYIVVGGIRYKKC